MERQKCTLALEAPCERLLEVRVMWGRSTLEIHHFRNDELVTVGDHPDARIRIAAKGLLDDLFVLASPGGIAGHVVQVDPGMSLSVYRGQERLPVEAVAGSAARRHALKPGEQCRVLLGQLLFVLEYVSPARGFKSHFFSTVDDRLVKWWLSVFLLAVGGWLFIESTPGEAADDAEYLSNPARFASLILPNTPEARREKFDPVRARQEEKKPAGRDVKRMNAPADRHASGKAIPHRKKEQDDRFIATHAGILDLIQQRQGGGGGLAGTVLGGSSLTNLDQQLAGLVTAGMGDPNGFGGMGFRGGGPQGGGEVIVTYPFLFRTAG